MIAARLPHRSWRHGRIGLPSDHGADFWRSQRRSVHGVHRSRRVSRHGRWRLPFGVSRNNSCGLRAKFREGVAKAFDARLQAARDIVRSAPRDALLVKRGLGGRSLRKSDLGCGARRLDLCVALPVFLHQGCGVSCAPPFGLDDEAAGC